MEFMSVKEAAQKWGISERRVRALCESGRIEGVSRCGDWVWSIPKGTERPTDGRTLRYMKNRNLRTGAQDYSSVDKIRKSSRNSILTDYQKASVIQESYAYSDSEFTREQILEIFRLKNQNLPLETQVAILNMRSALSTLPYEISEKSVCDINKKIMMAFDDKNGGKYKDAAKAQESQAIFAQYRGPWSILHPVARGAFLFAEIIRVEPFVKYNVQTAFIILASELAKAKLPPAVFGLEHIPELKAALASAKMRGNTQALVSMILQASGTK